MILFIPHFPGDESRLVMSIQIDTELDTMRPLVRAGLKRGLYAEALMEAHPSELGNFCRNLEQYDYRILRDVHAQIAAAYRFRYYRWPLLPPDESPTVILKNWQSFANKEFSLSLDSIDFATGFFDSLRFVDKERGFEGEATMKRYLQSRYRDMHSYTLPRVMVETV